MKDPAVTAEQETCFAVLDAELPAAAVTDVTAEAGEKLSVNWLAAGLPPDCERVMVAGVPARAPDGGNSKPSVLV